VFHFIERDEENYLALKGELAAVPLPSGIEVHPHQDDAFPLLEHVAEQMTLSAGRRWPAFFFVDPFGWNLPGDLLRRLMSFSRTELFIHVMWRELDMGIGHAFRGVAGMEDAVTRVFAGSTWRSRIDPARPADDRANQVLDLMADRFGGRWRTSIRLLGDNRATRSILLHLSNDEAGRDLMKDCVWRVCPQDGFMVRKNSDLRQEFLIRPSPDLRPLEDWLIGKLRQRPHRWSDLENDVRPLIWKSTHLNEIVRRLHFEGRIIATEYAGRFSRTANPWLALTP
jgi:three-Cys-motif partner protein